MNDKEVGVLLEAAEHAEAEVVTHDKWPAEDQEILRRIVFRAFIAGAKHAKNNP